MARGLATSAALAVLGMTVLGMTLATAAAQEKMYVEFPKTWVRNDALTLAGLHGKGIVFWFFEEG